MKLLHFALITPTSPQLGLRAALRSLGTTEYRELSWYPLWQKQELPAIREAFVDQVRAMKPDLVFAQIQTPGLLPAPVLERIRDMNVPIVSWCGDLRDETPDWAVKIAPYVINTFSNERDVMFLRGRGFRADYLNIGFSTDVFNPEGPKRKETPEIVFLGTNYAGRFPRSNQRQQIVAMLRARYGSRFAVYGHGWGPSDFFLNETEEAAAYRTCKIALDANHYDIDRFTSDRRFRAMGSGAFTLANYHPGIAQDFDDRKHLVVWKSPDEIPGLIDYYLDAPDERKAIARAGCEHVHRHHSWVARMEDLTQIIDKYRKAAA